MTITKEQLDELERAALAVCSVADHAVRHGIVLSLSEFQESLSADVTLQLVAVYRSALTWHEPMCDPRTSVSPGCTGWYHTSACEERRTEADKALRSALGAP
jgi:hypothetical protein